MVDFSSTPGVKADDPLTRRIIACAIEVHKTLGPGLLINFNSKLLKDGIKRFVI